MELERIWRHRWFRWGLITGIWTLFGLLFASQQYLATSRTTRPMAWYDALLLELSYAYLWALLTPLMLWLSRRFRIERARWYRSLLIHIFFGTLIGFTMVAFHDLIYTAYFATPERPFSLARMVRLAYSFFDYGMMTYWVILLVDNGLDYYRRYREGELRASQLEAMLAQAQLQALKMQLQPHFLFNTLHSISALLYKDVDAADKMIARLGDFLRITLENSGNQEVSLQEEIEFLKCYLEIERIRFQDRLKVQMDIEPQALQARLPNLILQPLVENAIKHGISAHAGPGRIRIHASRRDGSLQVEVTDNGPGLQERAGGSFKEGLGLANTQARLEHLYGSDHRLDMANAPLGGLTVILEIPFKTEPIPMKERYRAYWGKVNGGNGAFKVANRG
ncbi:MAG TPA: histidine kinase [Blastocatellia bacterium]|nr:histidine kinase [Blastocatellia bacterium]